MISLCDNFIFPSAINSMGCMKYRVCHKIPSYWNFINLPSTFYWKLSRKGPRKIYFQMCKHTNWTYKVALMYQLYKLSGDPYTIKYWNFLSLNILAIMLEFQNDHRQNTKMWSNIYCYACIIRDKTVLNEHHSVISISRTVYFCIFTLKKCL